MSPIQRDNWSQFAERMAWETHRWRTRERREKALVRVRDWIARFWSNYEPHHVADWDGNGAPQIGEEKSYSSRCYPGDEFDRYMDEDGLDRWNERLSETIEGEFGVQVMCCIRAGFDVAVAPSAGVIGARYTAGMIRRMFPEGLPPYVDAFFHGHGTKPDAPRFETLPDDRMVWL